MSRKDFPDLMCSEGEFCLQVYAADNTQDLSLEGLVLHIPQCLFHRKHGLRGSMRGTCRTGWINTEKKFYQSKTNFKADVRDAMSYFGVLDAYEQAQGSKAETKPVVKAEPGVAVAKPRKRKGVSD
jgi:hypothetical protein